MSDSDLSSLFDAYRRYIGQINTGLKTVVARAGEPALSVTVYEFPEFCRWWQTLDDPRRSEWLLRLQPSAYEREQQILQLQIEDAINRAQREGKPAA